MDEVRWGIIGCGDVVEHKSGPALLKTDRSRVVAVMSRNEDRARSYAQRHNIPRYYVDTQSLIEDDEVNAVYVATPPHVHARLTTDAAVAGKHVLCEKPMALTVAECEKMIEVCHHHRVQLMIAYYRRFFPVVIKIKEILDSEIIGRPLRARAEVADLLRDEVLSQRSWLVRSGIAGGGFLTDVATHRLDLFVFLLGNVTEVSAFIDTQHFDIEVDDASSLLLRFSSGVHATGAFNWNIGTPIDEFEIAGTEGRLLSRNLGRGLLEISARGTNETVELPPPAIPHLGLVEHYVQCLLSGEPNQLPGEAGMQATRITQAAYHASSEGKTIRLA